MPAAFLKHKLKEAEVTYADLAKRLKKHGLKETEALLMSNCDVGALTFPDECRYTVFALPRSLVAPLVPDLGALFAQHVPASNPALRMLLRYLELGHEDHLAASPELQTAFTDHVCDLLALCVGATRRSLRTRATCRPRGCAPSRTTFAKPVTATISRCTTSPRSIT